MIVYRFGVKGILEGLEHVTTQMRHGHDYANELTAIERARRGALHAVDDAPEVRAAVELVKSATRTDRKAALAALREARKAAREAASPEIERIQALDTSLRHDAREITPTYWGTYLTVEESAMRQRTMPLYEEDGITPALPRFRRWDGEGQVGVQIQKGLTTSEVREGTDLRVRLVRSERKSHKKAGRVTEYADLWIRVASEGRAPVWAVVRVLMHRQVPDAARWKYVRLSRRREGPTFAWTVEITVETDRPARTLDTSLRGVVAVEPCWIDRGGEKGSRSIVCALTEDDRGVRREIFLSSRIVGAIEKASDIRAIRDHLTNTAREEAQRLLVEAGEPLPPWLVVARETLLVEKLWKSPQRLHDLVMRWQREGCEAARPAYEVLDAWRERDDHLWRYEACSRGQAIRSRNDFYRCLAAEFSRAYRHALVPKRNYAREARFGPDADLRVIVAPFALLNALEAAFDAGTSLFEAPWDKDPEFDFREGVCERFSTGDPAIVARRVKKEDQKGGAWAARKRAKTEKKAEAGRVEEAGEGAA
jgi:hypothetical protein